MCMFTCVKENAFHRPHNSWLTEEVVHHVALAIVAGSRQAGSYSGPEVRFGDILADLFEPRFGTELSADSKPL